MDNWKSFGIIVIVIFVWYLACMVSSIILRRISVNRRSTSFYNASRALKSVSILNPLFKTLNDLTLRDYEIKAHTSGDRKVNGGYNDVIEEEW